MSHLESNSWKKYEHYVTIEFDAINTDIWDSRSKCLNLAYKDLGLLKKLVGL